MSSSSVIEQGNVKETERRESESEERENEDRNYMLSKESEREPKEKII